MERSFWCDPAPRQGGDATLRTDGGGRLGWARPMDDDSMTADPAGTVVLNRATVRPWRIEDATGMSKHANDRSIWQNLRDVFPHPYSVADAEAFITSVLGRPLMTSYAIEVEGEAAGSIGFRLQPDVERIGAEVGYWLGRKYWGRGIMSEVLPAMTQRAIGAFRLTRVFALPFAGNQASCRVLEKAGYLLEGRLRRSAMKDGEIVDQLLYAFVPEMPTWPSDPTT